MGRRLALLAAVALAATAAPVVVTVGGDGVGLRLARAAAQHEAGEPGGHASGRGRQGPAGVGHDGGCAGGGHGGSGSAGHGGCAQPGAGHVPGGASSDPLTGEAHDDTAHSDASHEDAGHAGSAKGRRGGPRGQGRGGSRDLRDSAAAQTSPRSPGDAHGGGGRVWTHPDHGGASGSDLGRLNVARVPARVLDRALAEAAAGLSPEAAAWYALPLDEALAGLAALGHGERLEGPLANLSFYRAVLVGDPALPIAPADRLDLAALLLGSAAGRHAPVERETVVTVNALLGVSDRLDAASLDRVTEGAERVRQAILAAHGGDHEDGEHDDGGHVPGDPTSPEP